MCKMWKVYLLWMCRGEEVDVMFFQDFLHALDVNEMLKRQSSMEKSCMMKWRQ